MIDFERYRLIYYYIIHIKIIGLWIKSIIKTRVKYTHMFLNLKFFLQKKLLFFGIMLVRKAHQHNTTTVFPGSGKDTE